MKGWSSVVDRMARPYLDLRLKKDSRWNKLFVLYYLVRLEYSHPKQKPSSLGGLLRGSFEMME